MVEKLSPADADVVNESLQANWLRRRVGAFLVTGLSLFLLLVFILALKVSAYRVDNSLSFRLNGSPQQLESLNVSIRNAMQESTTDDSLVQLVKTMKERGRFTSPNLLNSDLDSLRGRIKVYTRELASKGIAEARFSFVGSGTNDETQFLKQLTENIYASVISTNDFGEVDSALSQISGQLRGHLENQSQFSDSFYDNVAQLDQQLGRIRQHLAELGTQFATIESDRLEEQVRRKLNRDSQRNDALREMFLEQDEELFQHQHSSKELSAIEKQIAVLRTKGARVSTNGPDDHFQNNEYFDGPSFNNASYPNSRQPALPPALSNQLMLLNEEFQQLNTAGLYSVFDSIQDQRSSDLSAPIEFIESFKTSLANRVHSVTAVPLVKPGTTQVVPVGGLPTGSQVFWITLISLAFGFAIAWRLNPADSDRGFRDSSTLSETLGVPVVGSFPLQSAKIKKTPMATRIVGWCKFGLPIALIVIAACCLLNQSVWAQMVENPIRGLVRVVWLFKAR